MNRCAVLVSAASLLAGVANAEIFLFEGAIDGVQSGTSSNATGILTGEYDDVANTFTFFYSITDELAGSTTVAHIHNAPAGSAGGVVFGFASSGWNLSDSFTWSGLTSGQVDELFAGNLYANFHTSAFPGGEVRGQIFLVPAPGAAAILGVGGLACVRRRR